MSDLFDEVISQGASALEQMVTDRREETLHLEFKTLSDHSGRLAPADRKTIAKAICGMSNAEGGLLLIGVETTTEDQVDVATALRSIENIESFRNRVVGSLPDFLSPQHNLISVHPIRGDDDERGYLAVQIPASELRPHMSNPHHQYFRRGSNGTRVMEHGEVRDLMLAPREGLLGLNHYFKHSGTMGDHRYSFELVLVLRNVGRVAIRAPYIKIRGEALSNCFPLDNSKRRQHRDGSVGLYSDLLIHVEDEVEMGRIITGLHLNVHFQMRPKRALTEIRDGQREHAFGVGRDGPRGLLDDRLIDVEISFGAENARTVTQRLFLDKWSMFNAMADTLESNPDLK